MLKIGMSAITGIIDGIRNDKGIYEIKRGAKSNGERYQIFNIRVADKDIDGKWTNGKPIKVILNGNNKVEKDEKIGLVGRFQPDNYTNKEGKEIRGVMFVAKSEDSFTPENWDKKEEPNKPKPAVVKEEEVAWL